MYEVIDEIGEQYSNAAEGKMKGFEKENAEFMNFIRGTNKKKHEFITWLILSLCLLNQSQFSLFSLV